MPKPLSNAHPITEPPAQELEQAPAFYRGKLGFEPVERPPTGAAR